jgi:hypothetical protein
MLQNIEDDRFLPRVIFSDEATFHLSGKVNRHSVRIWGPQNPHTALEHEWDSSKVNVFAQYRKQRFMDLSFLMKTRLLA